MTPLKISDEELEKIDRGLTDDQWDRLLEYRGGCHCGSTGMCSNCGNPLNEKEAYELGFTDDPPGYTTIPGYELFDGHKTIPCNEKGKPLEQEKQKDVVIINTEWVCIVEEKPKKQSISDITKSFCR